MTRSRSSFIYIILVAVVCFAAGVASVFLRDDFLEPRQAPATITPETISAQPSDATPSERQITIVLFGVDDLSRESPELLALWFASFEPPGKAVRLLGIPVDSPLGESNKSIRDSFNLFEPPDFGASLLTALSAHAPYPIQGFIVLDEQGFSKLIDYIGGVTLEGQDLNGTAAVGALSLLNDRPLASLRMQARLMESLTENATSIGSTPELTPLTSLIPEHAYTSPSPYQLASLGSQLLPIDPANVTIEIQSQP